MSILINDVNDFLKGVEVIEEAVASTLGPRGRTVIIKNGNDKPFITKDGVTVSKNIKSDNAISQMAIDLIKEAASTTVSKTGDGTTTTTLLACKIIRMASPLIHNYNPYEFKIGMLHCVDRCKELIKDISITDMTKDMLINIATISANNNKEIGEFCWNYYLRSWRQQYSRCS
jgi:chaperonin GroEL